MPSAKAAEAAAARTARLRITRAFFIALSPCKGFFNAEIAENAEKKKRSFYCCFVFFALPFLCVLCELCVEFFFIFFDALAADWFPKSSLACTGRPLQNVARGDRCAWFTLAAGLSPCRRFGRSWKAATR
jgi:hypothetical protein